MMKESNGIKNLLLVSGLIGLLLLALIFDLVIGALAERNAELGGLDATLVWIFPLLELLFMLGIVGLLWLALSGRGYSRWVSVFYLVVGLLLLYTNPILFVNELPDSLYVLVEYLLPGSLLFQAGGAAAAFGLVTLFFWQGKSQEPDEEVEEEEPENHIQL